MPEEMKVYRQAGTEMILHPEHLRTLVSGILGIGIAACGDSEGFSLIRGLVQVGKMFILQPKSDLARSRALLSVAHLPG